MNSIHAVPRQALHGGPGRRGRLPIALVIAWALVVGAFGVTGGLHAEAATTPKPAKPKPALPIGPKSIIPLDSYGPRADDNMALRWTEQTLALVRGAALPPTAVSRALAVVQTSVYDAWAAYDTVAVGTRLGGSLRRPAEEHTVEHKSKAISFAAYRALLDLFPAQEPTTTRFMASLGYEPSDTTTDISLPQGVGNVAAAAVLQYRYGDGSNQHGEEGGARYSDYTGYRPVNQYDKVVDQWHWQPLWVTGAAAPQTFATPQWGKVTPFALSRPDQFGVPGPDLRKDYRKAVDDIVKFSAKLTDQDKAIAEYWADGPRSELPPGHGALFTAALCRMGADSLDEDVKLLFLQANAVLDAGIAAWHYKVEYDFARPVTLVHILKQGQQIKAWGGPGKGTVTMLGEQWQPYQPTTVVTPPFAEYVSGHSTFSAATFEVVRSFTGSDALGLSVTIGKGQSPVEPGLTPAKDVKLSWRTMQDAADQAGLSRRYGGIHFTDGDLDGRDLGTRIGQAVYRKAQGYFTGTAGR